MRRPLPDNGMTVDDFAATELRELAVRERDIFMLRELLDCDELNDSAQSAFVDMLMCLERKHGQQTLTTKQRSWVEVAAERFQTKTDPNPKPVPRGKEVPTSPVLRNLPKKPPKIAAR